MIQLELANPTGLALLALAPLFWLLARHSQRGMRPQRWRLALAARLGVLALLALALADPRLKLPADRLAVAFLIDVSDSMGSDAKADAARWVADALAEMPSGDEGAVVAFAADALVERTASPRRDLPPLRSDPAAGATDLSAALRVGLGLLPTDRARRAVLLSDGNENRGRALDEARLPAAAGVPIDFVAVGEARGLEASVRGLDAPGALRDGDAFTLRLTVESTVETSARVLLLTDGRLDTGAAGTTAPVHLNAGVTNVVLPHDPLPPGFHTFRVQIEPSVDTVAENNEAIAFTVVSGRPRVLVVEGTADNGRFLVDALRAGGLDATAGPPNGLPTDVAQLRAYDAVVLVNVPAGVFAPAQLRTLKTYVQSFGGGLTLVGGDRSFALGGYQRTPLEEMSPLSMQRRGARALSSVGLVLVVDNSGSMGDNVGGMSKMDLAKEAALGALDLLASSDQLGLVGFDDRPRWLRDITELDDTETARRQIRQMAPSGGTAIYPALEAAHDALAPNQAKVKHVVLLTDGISPAGDYPRLIERMRAAGITLSTIAVGTDADVNLLQQLADMGSGRFYEGSDPFAVPQILVKETLEIARTAVVEEPFRPVVVGSSPILDGLAPNAFPALRGYVAVTPKPASLVVLGSRQGDAVLAEWQYGLGQVVAWTSDVENRWSADWVEWPEFSRFWSQVVKRTVPARVEQNLQTTVAVEGDRARITVDAIGDDRSFRNDLPTTATLLAPDGRQSELRLEQSGPGRYEALHPLGPPGAYLLQVVQRSPDGAALVAQQSTGFVTGQSAEYRQLRPNRQLLQDLARATGGRELKSPADAFVHNLQAPGAGRELWPVLAALATVLFLLDVAVRRLRVSFSAIEDLLVAARARLLPARARPARGALAPRMAQLLAAKRGASAASTSASTGPAAPAGARLAARRAEAMGSRASAPRPSSLRQGERAAASFPLRVPGTRHPERAPSAPPGPVMATPRPSPAAPATPASDRPAAGSTASRLLAAKQRARSGR
ncbi:MAG TPA: VWA domain-containing protein [Chloroflexota bacterium]|nr:VWA domain-containing protein [Chloroflexota bacterium]